jgi:hypothetical protein
MSTEKRKLFLLFIIGSLVGILGMYLYQNFNIVKNNSNRIENNNNNNNTNTAKHEQNQQSNTGNSSIDQLTEENLVIDYVKANKKLPDYYITKGEARKKGWIASQGNLCDVLPGNAIGGDNFSNREKILPKNGKYYEADVNYNCGNRNADRIVFTNNGEVWLTKNHYKSFDKQ